MYSQHGPLLLLGLAGALAGGPRSAQAQSFPDSMLWWSVSYQKIVDRDEGLLLDDQPFTATLANGWICEVGKASHRDALTGSRTTVCSKDDNSLSFRVHCDRQHPDNYVERRFRATAEGPADFIVVGCVIWTWDPEKALTSDEGGWPPLVDKQVVGENCRVP